LIPLLRKEAMEFPTQEALKKYLDEHPDADRAMHKVVETKKEEPAKEEKKEPTGEKPVSSHKKTQVRKNTLKNVSKILEEYKIADESDEMQELAGFKKEVRKNSRIPDKDIGQYYVRNQTKLKKDFLANMDRSNYDTPQEFEAAKKRISQMSPNEFGKVLAAINEDEEIA
jgi:hypothetical protein